MARAGFRRGPRAPTILYTFSWLLIVPLMRVVFRRRVYGTQHLPGTEGFVLAANHVSVIDPWPLGYPFFPRQLRFMAKAELFRPGLRWPLRSLGAFPVRRGRGDRDAVDAAARLVREGDVVLIFPEGTTLGKTDPTKLRDPFHRGAAKIALRAEAPLVPVAIQGTDRLSRLGRIRLAFAAPVELEDLRGLPPLEAARIATQRLRVALEALLSDLQTRDEKRDAVRD